MVGQPFAVWPQVDAGGNGIEGKDNQGIETFTAFAYSGDVSGRVSHGTPAEEQSDEES